MQLLVYEEKLQLKLLVVHEKLQRQPSSRLPRKSETPDLSLQGRGLGGETANKEQAVAISRTRSSCAEPAWPRTSSPTLVQYKREFLPQNLGSPAMAGTQMEGDRIPNKYGNFSASHLPGISHVNFACRPSKTTLGRTPRPYMWLENPDFAETSRFRRAWHH